MGLKSTTDHYGNFAVIIHWLSALLIFALIGSGFQAADSLEDISKVDILRFHIPLGMAIFLLTVARIVWWVFVDTKPQPLLMPKWQDRVSRTVHILLYIVILGMGASGIGMLLLSGAAPIIFSGEVNVLPDFWNYLPRTPHGIGARIILILLVFHIGGALYHHFIKRDGLIWRMWFLK